MDAPDLDRRAHRDALAGLARLNAASRTAAALWSALAPLVRDARQPLRVLDLACGGGDVIVALARRARRAGCALDASACDASPEARRAARERAAAAGVALQVRAADLAAPQTDLAALASGHDVVLCTLFLHHLEDEQAVALLAALGRARPRRLLVDDLRRSRAGYALVWAATRLLSRSPVVHHDGPLSVARAFTAAEARALAARAGLAGARVRRRWPARWLLQWSPSP